MASFGNYFTYNGHSSSEFNCIIATFDQVDSYNTGLFRDVQRGDINRYRYKPNHFGTVYADVLTFNVTLIKNICDSNEAQCFSRSEYREIAAWLTEPEYPKLYEMTEYTEDWNDEAECYFGIFSNVENHAAGEIVGITATFTCDSPFAWGPLKTVSWSESGPKTVNIDSDVKYTYPIISFTANSACSIAFRNITDDDSIIFEAPTGGDVIVIDSNKLTITDNAGIPIYLSDIGVSDPTTVYWPRLLQGNNTLTYTGDATVTMTYREARKVGAY